MGLTISNNTASAVTSRHLSQISEDQLKSFERLASGQKIVRAGDDAAGLSISESLRSEVRSMRQAERNANDAISFAQVAEGGLTEISNTMIRLRELGIQAASDTVGDRERQFINEEVQMLLKEVDRIANSTSFNDTHLLNGTSSKGVLQFQIGTHNRQNDQILFDPTTTDVTSGSLGIDSLDFSSIEGAQEGLSRIDSAMGKILSGRALYGTMQVKLESAVRSDQLVIENLSQARSRIVDTDVAEESSQLVKNNILQAAGISILAQANTSPSQVLKLL